MSNLPFISKLTERAVFEQTHTHIVDNDLYPSAQSSYRRNHSTEIALLKVKNDLLMNMNEQHVSLLVLFDMSAAFDTVDHCVLLERLSSKFGFTGGASSWFRSYLSQRSRRIVIRGTDSEKFDVPYGVPQGSCLGPLLFTIYASKLLTSLKNSYRFHIVMQMTRNCILHLDQPKNVVSQMRLLQWNVVSKT